MDSRSKQVAKAIGSAVGALASAPTAEVARRLDECHAQLGSVAESEYEQLELARRIAESKLSIFWKRPDAQSFIEDAWREIESLGFSSAEREASMLCYRIKAYAIADVSDVDRNRQFGRLRKAIEVLRRESPDVANHFERVYAQLLHRPRRQL